MTAIKNNNTIIIRNTERQSEDVFFNKIVIAFENNRNILIKNKIMGPSENVVIAKGNGDEINLIYDIDYGIYPIECTANNDARPPPRRSRISPPVPVAAPLKGSTVVGKL